MDILTIILVFLTCGFVASPLFRSSDEKHKDRSELEQKQPMIQNIIDELTLDYETGKLSKEDYETLVQEHQQFKPESNQTSQKHIKNKCPQCGHKINKKDKFCSNCGLKL